MKYILVPVEPTEEALRSPLSLRIYRAMLAAAPPITDADIERVAKAIAPA